MAEKYPGSWMWPTPNASPVTFDGPNCSGDGREKPNKLGWAVQMWPTPTANNYESEPEVFLPRREREREKHNNGNGFGLTLGMAVRLWPTPTTQDASNNGGPTQSLRNTVPLNARVQMWPTPNAQDSKDNGNGTTDYHQLNKEVGGALSPTWVEWLQGFPLGWTEV
jgi:hypothetical protein